jgi:hypothetical protein
VVRRRGRCTKKNKKASREEPRLVSIFLRIISKHPHAKLVTEWLKVAEIALVMVPGSVEDERLFSIMNLIKNELRNRLKNPLLTDLVRLFASKRWKLSDFPFEKAIEEWEKTARRSMGEVM